jgi:multiple sugar transport system substrate-binding protein
MIAIATYFNGKDLGTGTPGTGVSMHLKTGNQGMFHYMSLSAPFVIGPNNPKHYWFNPETMEPLVKSQGHINAMQAYLDLAKQGPEAQLGWALGEAWDWFLNGNAVFTFSWGDVAALAVQNNSFVKGKIGTTQLPGTTSYVNALTGEEVTSEGVNKVGNTTGGSWSGVIAKNASNAEAVYYFWALTSAKPKIQYYAGVGSDGVDPGRFSQMPPEDVEGGTGSIDLYLSQGWVEQDAREYAKAYYESFNNPNQFPYLRIPGAAEYWNALDIRLSEAVSGGQTPEQACEAMYNDFNEITDRLGVDAQLAEYKASFGF